MAKDLALVGAGYWGKNLARNFCEIGSLHTLCDSSEVILSGYGDDYAGVEKSTSLDEVLAHPEIRKIAIAAPAHLHYEMARAALLAGKDVYVEKPLCLDVAEGEELVRLADEHSRILMVGHLLQYHPCITRIQQLVESGELGKLQYITSNRLNLGKFRQEENALWSFAPHDISVILSLVGNQVPDEVRCVGGAYLTAGIADTTLSTFRFSDGVRGHVYVSWLNPFKEQKLTVVGSQGMVVFDDTRPWPEKLVIHRDYLTWAAGRTPTPNKADGEPIIVSEAEPLRQECLHFVQSCSERRSPKTNGREGLRVLQVLRAAHESLQHDGKVVSPSVGTAGRTLSYYAHPTAVIDKEATIGSGSKIWHFSHVMAQAELGERCNLGQNVVISSGVKLGSNVKVQNNVSIYTGIVIEDDVFLGPSCVLTNVTNPRSQVNRRNLYEATTIRRGATVGANATIICGVTLGRYCFVAAGAVVTKDVPDYALVRGNPARRSGWMSRHGHLLEFSSPGTESGVESVRCIDLPEEKQLPSTMVTGRTGYNELRRTTKAKSDNGCRTRLSRPD